MHNLTALQVKNARPGQKISDGGGLRLDVDKAGNKQWIFRFTSPVTGRERYMGLGALRDVPLAEARKAAQDARNQLREGVDPIDRRNEQRAAARAEVALDVTFSVYADRYIKAHEAGWRNPKHRQQWRNTLRDYVNPLIGHWPVADIDTPAVLSVLQPIWQDKPETGSRVRGRIEAILSAAKAEGLRRGENPAAWRGHLDHLLPSKRRVRRVVHHPALPYSQIPAFMASLKGDTHDSAQCLSFIILTACRYNEATKAHWLEIDGDTWAIPAARMKADRPHVVPLSDAAMAVLATIRERYGDAPTDLIFPGAKRGRPLSDVSLANCIRRHTDVPATTHGMRSTFRDWAGDKTNFPREVAEMALAHVVGDGTEAAYRRGTALEKRRRLLQAWGQYCTIGENAS